MDVEHGMAASPTYSEVLPVWQVATRYQEAGLPVVIVAGERCYAVLSRGWADKGAQLFGGPAVLANSFEPIHHASLVCMGVLPPQFPPG